MAATRIMTVMDKMPPCVASLAIVCAALGVAHGETELRNDSFENGQAVVAHDGFAPGEIAASRFFIATPVRLIAARLIFANAVPGGNATDVTLHVWTDDQTSTEPGVELYSGDFTVTPSQVNMQELNVSAENITVGGYFRVGIEVHHGGAPSVTNDTNGISSALNNLLKESTLGWQTSSLFGVSGDWIIRAVVSDGGGAPDAGVTPDASTGSPDASTGPDAGSGGQCNGNGDCEVGEYCDTAAHTCTFDCRHDTDCPGNDQCNSLGQCVGATDGGGGCCSTGETGGGAGEGALGALGLAGLVGAMVTRRRSRAKDGAGSGSQRR